MSDRAPANTDASLWDSRINTVYNSVTNHRYKVIKPHATEPETVSELDPSSLTSLTGPQIMPYNNAAIPPSDEITGSASLPVSRVKRILAADEDIAQCSNNAAFAITIATEMFVQHFTERALEAVKAEKKPRRNIQYKDLANTVARHDSLEFLADVVPRTMTYKEYKEKKVRAAKAPRALPEGQTTLDGKRPSSTQIAEQINPNDVVMDEKTMSPGDSLGQLSASQPTNGTSDANDALVFEHYEPNGNHKDEDSDVEMG